MGTLRASQQPELRKGGFRVAGRRESLPGSSLCSHFSVSEGSKLLKSRLGEQRKLTAGYGRKRASNHVILASRQSPLLDLVPKHKVEELLISLPQYDTKKPSKVDLLVVGGGPAGLSVAQRVSASGLSVCCVDPAPTSVWPNNYGVWVDEFEAMGLDDCLDFIWPRAVVHLDSERIKYLDRPYGRVNRVRLKTKVISKCVENGVVFHKAKADSISHLSTSSSVLCSDGTEIIASIVLDATGFSRRLIEYSEPYDPGFQAAWGILAEVESHPFDLDKMLFMDWRDDHLESGDPLKAQNEAIPTFLYAMPFSKTRIFLEETSLVGRPAVPFSEIQERMEKRLRHLGIKVTKIEEEEYCLIPMGGVLPDMPQRILGIGGTAGMVHPSTGYMVARTLGSAPEIAEAIIKELNLRTVKVSPLLAEGSSMSSGGGTATLEKAEAALLETSGGDDVSARVWAKIWPAERQEQREFFCFGMDVLLRLDLQGTRRFFDAFFDLSPYHWQGFLSSRLYLGELIKFGLALFAHATNYARAEIIAKGLPGLGILISNVVKIKTSEKK